MQLFRTLKTKTEGPVFSVPSVFGTAVPIKIQGEVSFPFLCRLSFVKFVMAAAGLCGRHRFALRDIYLVYRFALAVHHLVSSAAGSIIAAIEFHIFTSDTNSLRRAAIFKREA